jgi:excisionase family DNA binding protein
MTSEQKEEKAMPRLWTAKEVADYWGIAYCTILRQIHSNQIPSIRVGRSYRIKDEVVKNGITNAN